MMGVRRAFVSPSGKIPTEVSMGRSATFQVKMGAGSAPKWVRLKAQSPLDHLPAGL